MGTLTTVRRAENLGTSSGIQCCAAGHLEEERQ